MARIINTTRLAAWEIAALTVHLESMDAEQRRIRAEEVAKEEAALAHVEKLRQLATWAIERLCHDCGIPFTASLVAFDGPTDPFDVAVGRWRYQIDGYGIVVQACQDPNDPWIAWLVWECNPNRFDADRCGFSVQARPTTALELGQCISARWTHECGEA